MSVVVDFEEARHRASNEALLRKMFAEESVDLLTALRSQTNYHLIARVSGVVLGSLVAVPLEGANQGVVQVVAMAVEPAQRHHGIARSMLNALVDESRREYHRYVITHGPKAVFETLDWSAMQTPQANRYVVKNYQESALPLDSWWSKPTRSMQRRMLTELKDPAGLIQAHIHVSDNVYPTSSPIREPRKDR